jgi:hypothetical protein
VNGPQRPRRDDVRRYCLACSASTGRLVERTAPSLERQRQQKQERSAARRVTARDRERTLERERRSIGSVNIDAEARRLWNLPVFKRQPRWKPGVPTITVRRSAAKRHTSGHSYFNHGGIVLTVGSDLDEALGVLLHELAHPIIGKPDGEIHPESFWTFLRSAAREAWPDAPFQFNLPAKTAWDRQHQITLGLRRRS